MKITFVLPRFDLTGGNRVISIYAEGLRRRGHEVVAVAPRRPRPSLRSVARSLARGTGWPQQSEASHFDEIAAERIDANHGAPIVASDLPDADVVVATWWETAEWVSALPARKGTQVHFMQDYEVWGGPKARVDASCLLPMPKIVIAQWTYELLRDEFERTPIALIPNSVDSERFFAPPRDKRKAPTVGLTYTSFHNKGTDISLAAFDLARREIPELKLVAFGRSEPSRRLPLPPGTEYFRHAPDATLKEIYARCDAWLFGTRIEGFGLPVLEAMACRTPVIGTPGGAAPEILHHGGGILVPHEDPRAMADAIVAICGMTDERWRALSTEALQVSQRSNWNDAIQQFETALKQVVGGSAAHHHSG